MIYHLKLSKTAHDFSRGSHRFSWSLNPSIGYAFVKFFSSPLGGKILSTVNYKASSYHVINKKYMVNATFVVLIIQAKGWMSQCRDWY